MQFSDEVMADVERWCPQLQAGATLVTVNQRLSRHYQRRYDAWQLDAGAAVWDTPTIVSWSAWLLQLHDDALCEGLTENPILKSSVDERLWRRAVEQASTRDGLVLLDKTAAAKQARAAWLIQHAWHCHVGEDAQVSMDQLAYSKWSNAYRQLCHRQNSIDESRLAPHLRDRWADLKEQDLLPSSILFAGFLTPTTEQQVWWEGLAEHEVSVERLEPVNSPTEPSRFDFIDDATEWVAAAGHARAWLEENPQSLIGVVVPELNAHRTDILRAFDSVFFPGKNPLEIQKQGRPYDVSLGVSLAEQPVVKSALQVLRFCLEPIAAADVTSVLLSPYFNKMQSAADKRRRFDRRLRNDRQWEFSAKKLADSPNYLEALDATFAKAFPAAVKTLDVKPQSFSAWSDRFGRVLQRQLKWPGESLDSLEYQAVQVWQQVIDELESLDDGENVSAVVALGELQNLCAQRLFQPETPRAPIQIMGRLESHGLTFDHLWLSGCDAGQWPPKAVATTLLPRSLQQTRGVPESSANHRLDAARIEWMHWCQSAPKITASCALTRDGQPLLPAACVADLIVQPVDQLLGHGQYKDLIATIADQATLQVDDDSHGPALVPGVRVRGGARRLEDQAKCPFRGFAIHHLGIQMLEDPGMGLDPREHGNLLHFALEKFWESVKTSAALNAMEDAECDAEILSAINQSLEEYKVDPQLAELERARLSRLIADWLAIERRRIGFTVEAMEQEHLVDIYGFEIRVLIDRIDKLDTGERVILDYKTGRNNQPKDWALPRIGNPQLPLYATIDEGVEGVSFAQVVQNDMGFKGLTREPHWLPRVNDRVRVADSPQDWDEWREHWRDSLDQLAEEIRAGVATITPDAKACQYCDLKPLCRYRASENELAEEESDDR